MHQKQPQQPHKLPYVWTFWENRVISAKDKPTSNDYLSAIRKLFTFSSLEQLASYWKHPDSLISSILNFFNHQAIKEHSLNNEIVASDTISLFRDGVQPAWEDPRNKQGGQFYTFIKRAEGDWDSIYSSIVFAVISNSFSINNKILGIRFHYKEKVQKGNDLNLKVEFWTEFNSKDGDLVDRSAKEVKKMLQDCGSPVEDIKFKDHAY